jgi:hypothetical protein
VWRSPWAKRGSRPSAPRDQRTRSAWLFGAICPREGKAASLVLPRCNTKAMTLHLAEITQVVKEGVHELAVRCDFALVPDRDVRVDAALDQPTEHPAGAIVSLGDAGFLTLANFPHLLL